LPVHLAALAGQGRRYGITGHEMKDMRREAGAWIEDSAGKEVPIRGACHLGRATMNQVVVPDPLVSRRHALIQAQGDAEYWLVDFGSRNGTYLNNQRIAQPSRLNDGDEVRIGGSNYVFRQAEHDRLASTFSGGADQTVFDVRLDNAWLLVADIIGSTQLISLLPPDELPLMTGKWLATCRDTIESCGGRINQFMGDGFFACWRDHPGREADIVQAMQALHQQQLQAHPPFRCVIHLGPVVFGGMAIGEEERISGGEVHFAFRMEKLAGQLEVPCLLSEPVKARLAGLLLTHDAGSHVLPGFQDAVGFHAWSGQG
jgi:adenylate cyclase